MANIELKILERDAKHCEELTVQLPKALILNGDGSNTKLLIEEGIEDVESFVPLTGIDEENVLLTLYAKKLRRNWIIKNQLTFTLQATVKLMLVQPSLMTRTILI